MSNDPYAVTTRQPTRAEQARRRGFHMAEAFFRRWPLFILPIILLPVVGFMQARKTVADYKSTVVMDVVTNPLIDLGDLQGNNATGQETPAAATARTIAELLGTDGFVDDIAERAGLKTALDTRQITRLDIRSHVGAGASGYQLVQIGATWPSGYTAQQLAQATIDSYVNYIVASQVSKTKDASAFWGQRVAAYEDKLKAAQKALQDYVLAHPAPDIGERSDAETLDMQALSDAIDQAQEQVSKAEEAQENADLSTQQLTTAAKQALQVVDKPTAPEAPESIKKKQALMIAIFFVLGVIVTGALLVIATFLDRAVRSPEDIRLTTGQVVVATVPAIRSLTKAKPNTSATATRPASPPKESRSKRRAPAGAA